MHPGDETAFLEWLRSTARAGTTGSERVELGIGDDMAELVWPEQRLFWASDMLLEGVHFESTTALADVGHKAVGVVLSDCAAMAVQPCAVLVSLALPADRLAATGTPLIRAMRVTAERFACALVGGDTTAWNGPVVIDVAVAACPWPDCVPVRRDGARPGDHLLISGRLGGSRAAHHLRFEPRVATAHALAADLGPDLHALIDISDGLSLDLARLCEASGCGAALHEPAVLSCATTAARQVANTTTGVLDHVLNDGEDFELLAAVVPAAAARATAAGWHAIGVCTPQDIVMQPADGPPRPLPPRGFVHGASA